MQLGHDGRINSPYSTSQLEINQEDQAIIRKTDYEDFCVGENKGE